MIEKQIYIFPPSNQANEQKYLQQIRVMLIEEGNIIFFQIFEFKIWCLPSTFIYSF